MPFFKCKLALAIGAFTLDLKFEYTVILYIECNPVISVSCRIRRFQQIVSTDRKFAEVYHSLWHNSTIHFLIGTCTVSRFHRIRISLAVTSPALQFRIPIVVDHPMTFRIFHLCIDRKRRIRQFLISSIDFHEVCLKVTSNIDHSNIGTGNILAEICFSVIFQCEDTIVLAGISSIPCDKSRSIRHIQRSIAFPEVFVMLIRAQIRGSYQYYVLRIIFQEADRFLSFLHIVDADRHRIDIDCTFIQEISLGILIC